tara:strand:+ start:5118 stop:8303 length:3186 start_codon:yes stop_codon:yes gene_type:complete
MAYQSFGSYGSFKFTPDLGRSRKILQARSEEREAEDRYLNQLQQQQRSYMEVMRQKLRDEQAQRDRNFQIEAGFRQQYQDAVERNDETEINNLEIKRRQSAEFMKSLSDFSQTLGKKFIEVAEEKKKKQGEKQFNDKLSFLMGLSPDELNEEFRLQAGQEATLQGSDSSLNGIANSIADANGNNAAEPYRRTAFGSMSIHEQRAYLTFLGSNLNRFAEINKDFKFKVSDNGEIVKLTLNEAKQRGGVIAKQAFDALTLETIKQLGLNKGEVSPEFLLRNYIQPANAYNDRELAKSEAARDQRLGQMAELRETTNIRQKVLTDVLNSTDPTSPYSISTLVTTRGAEHKHKYTDENGKIDYAYIRDTAILPEIGDMVKDGVFDDNLEAVTAYLDRQLLVLNETGKPVSLQSIKSSDALAELNLTIKGRQRTIDGQREQEKRSAALEDVNRLYGAALEDGVVTPTERHKINKAMFAAHKDDPATLNAVMNASDNFGLDDSENLDKESEFLSMVSEGKAGRLTALEVQQNLNWLSKEQREELTGYVDAFNSEDPEKEGYKRSDIEKQAKSMFRSALSELDIGKGVDSSVDWAVTEVGDYYVEQYMKIVKDGGDPEFAAQEARITTMTLLSGGMKDPTNQFYVVTAAEAEKTQGYIKGFKIGKYSVAQQTNTHQQLKDISQNPSLLSTDVYLSDRYLADIEGDIKNGRMIEYTPIVNQIASMTNQLPYEVINQQLQAAKIDQKIEPGAFDKLVEVAEVSPALKKLLAEPTASRINTAIIGTGNAVGTVRRGTDGEQDVMSLAQIAKFKAPPLAAAMWALETGRGATVSSNTLFKGIRSPFESYESPLQSAQALTDYVSKVPGFNDAKTYREAITALSNYGYTTDPQFTDKVIGALKDMGYNADDPIREYTGNPATNPNGMSPTLRNEFYRTGSVMAPGMAPSEHLDVKQIDNPATAENETNAYFEPDALEQYVEVDDPKFGTVGLEELTDKYYGKGKRPESMKFTAPRSWRNGMHLGWDYPTAEGSILRLKGGARLVGGYQTEFGYKAIIEIPNGSRYSFLHGHKL